MLVKKGSFSPSFGINIKKLKSPAGTADSGDLLMFFQWKKNSVKPQQKTSKPFDDFHLEGDW